MLCHLHISNFAIVRALEIDWASGMSTITGETGAGKSIAIDALSLCLGERADATVVRPGADKADIVASFDVSKLTAAQQWLAEQDLAMGNECIVRRVVSSEGRSRGYINGVQVPAQQLKALGQHLLSIHGQHAHQLLLKADYQRQLLDAFASNNTTLEATRSAWRLWQKLQREYAELQQSQQQREFSQMFELLRSPELSAEQLPAGYREHFNAQQEQQFSRLQLTIALELVSDAPSPDTPGSERQQVQLMLLSDKHNQGTALDKHSLLQRWLQFGPLSQAELPLLARIKALFV